MAAAPKDADVRSVIRSILVSNPNEMTLQFLDRDFKEMEGYPIPYHKFGFKSLLDYVKSIPDTVTVKGSFSNPVVLPVATEKAAHVEKLVLKQRLATNRRMPARRTRNHGVPSNVSKAPPPAHPSHERKDSTQRKDSTRVPSIFELKFNPTEMEKMRGGQAFNGAPNFNDMSHVTHGPVWNHRPDINSLPFIPAYPFPTNSNIQGQPLFMGYPPNNISFQPPRPTEPRWSQPNFNGAKPYASPAVLPPPAPQKPPTANVNHRDSIGNNNNNVTWPKKSSHANICPAGAEPSVSHDQLSMGSRSDDGSSAENDYLSTWANKSVAERYHVCSSKTERDDNDNDDDDTPISNRMKENFKTLLRRNPEGFFCSELPSLYETEFNAPFSYDDYGYNSIIQMVSDHPKIFSFTRYEKNGDWLLKPFGSEQNKSGKSLKRWVPTKIIQNITRILEHFPGGLPMSQLLDKYKEYTNESFDFRQYGESLQLVINDMENYVHQRRAGNEILLYDASKLKRTVLASESLVSTPALPNIEMSLLHKDLYPAECCSYSDVIVVQKLPEFTESRFIEVRVGDLQNPYKMWFQLGKCYDALLTMMKDLHEFYTRYESKYVMPEVTVRPRQLCACLFGEGNDEKWHRASILSCSKDQYKVTVEYIDYGTTLVVNRSILRFLHKDFSKLPRQAIKGRLLSVYPPVGCKDWPYASNQYLQMLTSSRRLMLEVVNQHDNLIEGFLYDTNGDEDILINDELVNSGHASLRKNDPDQNSSESPILETFAPELNSPNPSFISDKSLPWHSSPKFDDMQTSTNQTFKVNTKSLRNVNPNNLIKSITRNHFISVTAKEASTLDNGLAKSNNSIENNSHVNSHQTTSIKVEDLFKKFDNGEVAKYDSQLSNSSIASSPMSKSANSPVAPKPSITKPMSIEEKLRRISMEPVEKVNYTSGSKLYSLLKKPSSVPTNGAKSLDSPKSDGSVLSESDDSTVTLKPSIKKPKSIEERIKVIAGKLEEKLDISSSTDCNSSLKTLNSSLVRKKRKSLLDFVSQTNGS